MIVLDMADKRPIYEQIVERFKELIAIGAFAKDEKLPSVRQLAIDLSINPNTIQRAYGELEHAGFIYSVKGRGNFVADITEMVPMRQSKYLGDLDSMLSKAEGYALCAEDVIRHVKEYYEKNPKSDVKISVNESEG